MKPILWNILINIFLGSLSWATTLPESTSYIPSVQEFPVELNGVVQLIDAALHTPEREQLLKNVAEELANTAVARGNEDKKLFLSGFIQYCLRNYNVASSDFKKSLSERESNELAKFFLVLTLAAEKKCKEAMQIFDQLSWRNDSELNGPGTAELLLVKAQCLTELDQADQAKLAISQAKQITPLSAVLKRRLIEFSAQDLLQGDLSNPEIKELAVAYPDDKNIQLFYGRSLAKKGDLLTNPAALDEAEELATKYLKDSNFKDEVAFKILFDVLLKRRMFSAAASLVEQTQSVLPESIVVENAKKQLDIEQAGRRVLLAP